MRFFNILTVAIGLALTAIPAFAASDDGPTAVVERLDGALLTAMKNAEQLGYQGRYDMLAPSLEEAFDFPFMARASVGSHWRSLTKDEQQSLVDAFGRLSTATFAKRFGGYKGERFEIKGEEERPHGTVLVRNDLIKSDGTPVAIDFLLREKEGTWRIIDIYLDSTYSELATKRSEYTSVIENNGFDHLIAAMDEHVDSLAK